MVHWRHDKSENPIKGNKIHTFATSNTTFKLQGKYKENIAMKDEEKFDERFIWLHTISWFQTKNQHGGGFKMSCDSGTSFSYKYWMKYEKNPKNLKAKLLQKLESSVASVKPVSMDVMIIDAMFF